MILYLTFGLIFQPLGSPFLSITGVGLSEDGRVRHPLDTNGILGSAFKAFSRFFVSLL